MSPRSARNSLGKTPRGQVATRVAFAIIVLFVLAQVGWWLIFQQRYMSEVTRERLLAWERDAATATIAYVVSGRQSGAESGGDPELAAELLQRYPHLRLAADGTFAVDEAVREEFVREQRRYSRMFAFEVPFFGLVVLLSLIFIAANLRSERELKRRQQNFISAVTHEFKTPISTLRLLIETALLRPMPAEKSREYLKRMAAEVGRLEQTSDQVLASARLEQAPGEKPLAPFELSDLVRREVERMRQGLEARGATVELRLADAPLPISADEDAFKLVLGNLLDNAVKYSPGPTKPIRVRLEARGDLALLHVEDEGVGIGEGEQKRVFDRFYRSGDEMTRESPGMGLGLHLVRSTVEAMNGWVRCENREDTKGARFTVVLPKRHTAEAARGSYPAGADTGAA